MVMHGKLVNLQGKEIPEHLKKDCLGLAKHIGLDNEVFIDELKGTNGDVVPFKALASDFGGERRYYGTVTGNYQIYQNKDAFQWFQPWVESGVAELIGAGAVKQGRSIWIQAQTSLDGIEITKGDYVNRFLFLFNSHNGKSSIRPGFNDRRMWCNNQLASTLRSKATSMIRIRHSGDVIRNVDKIRDIMNLAKMEFEATAEQYRFLASREFNEADLQKYVKIVMDVKEDSGTKKKNLCEKLLNLVFDGKGQKETPNSWWRVLNGFTEYVTHYAGRNEDNRINSLYFGAGEQANRRAMELALEFANGQAA